MSRSNYNLEVFHLKWELNWVDPLDLSTDPVFSLESFFSSNCVGFDNKNVGAAAQCIPLPMGLLNNENTLKIWIDGTFYFVSSVSEIGVLYCTVLLIPVE